MIYTFVGNFQNIKYFLAEGSHSAIFDKEYNLKLDGVDFDKSNGHFFFLEDRLYYSRKGQDGKTVIFDMKTNLSEEVDAVLMKNTLYNNTFLQSTDLQMDENYCYSAKISVFQFNPAKKLYDLPKRYTDYQRLRIGDLLLTERSKYLLSSLPLLTGEYEWEVDLGGYTYELLHDEKPAEIRHIIGVWENVLLVWMAGG